MTRDYSQFFSASAKTGGFERSYSKIDKLGWQPFFAQQVGIDELAQTPPVRIVEVHRSALQVLGNDIDEIIPFRPDVTVGDWLLLDRSRPGSSRRLERKSLLKRRAPGSDRQEQLIAANIDTAFIVSSCNQDFNIARLERYAALAFEAKISPVILLTKADLTPAAEDYVARARRVSDLLPVVALDARGAQPKKDLVQWCKPGETVAFLGSSGVGKSTLVNALTGTEKIRTQGIREDDAKGRHTTTRRQLHLVPGGCLLLDTPGMRELQLTDAASGIEDLFADLHQLSRQCRFSDCRHETEPGCAVLQAVETGEVEETRLRRWRKLKAEETLNSASLAERRSRDKAFGKMVRQVVKHKRKRGWDKT